MPESVATPSHIRRRDGLILRKPPALREKRAEAFRQENPHSSRLPFHLFRHIFLS
jgi:hypothetical protein